MTKTLATATLAIALIATALAANSKPAEAGPYHWSDFLSIMTSDLGSGRGR